VSESSAALRMRAADPTGLLNKYALPKVAMVVIAAASAVGCVLTVAIGGGMGYAAAAASYVLLMAAGTAGGGLLWQRAVAAPALRLVGDAGAEAYAQRQVQLFRRIEAWCWPLAAASLLWLAPLFAAAPQPFGTAERRVLALAAAALAAWGASALRRRRSARPEAEAGWAAGAVGALLVAAGWLQVWHDDPGNWQLLLWRGLHLLAFAAWFGGAVWNVGIAVRAARERLDVSVVMTAHVQLDRFRRIVRVALPLILATGLLQVYDFFGWHVRAAASGAFGHLILVKLGLIALLVVIFNTCPMWHACSPIAGMCSLDDLPAAGGPAGRIEGEGAGEGRG
jgi:uncharacterized membrane protein